MLNMRKLRFMNRKKSRSEITNPDAIEIARLAQGTPVVGYHDKDGYLVIPIEYDDEYDRD